MAATRGLSALLTAALVALLADLGLTPQLAQVCNDPEPTIEVMAESGHLIAMGFLRQATDEMIDLLPIPPNRRPDQLREPPAVIPEPPGPAFLPRIMLGLLLGVTALLILWVVAQRLRRGTRS